MNSQNESFQQEIMHMVNNSINEIKKEIDFSNAKYK